MRFDVDRIGMEEAQMFMKSYLDRYGVTREALLILSVMVYLFASASVTTATKIILHQHKREIQIMKSLGASDKVIKTDLLAKLLVPSLAASCLGIILAVAVSASFWEKSSLQILSHRVLFQPDPTVIALNLALASLLITLTIARWNPR